MLLDLVEARLDQVDDGAVLLAELDGDQVWSLVVGIRQTAVGDELQRGLLVRTLVVEAPARRDEVVLEELIRVALVVVVEVVAGRNIVARCDVDPASSGGLRRLHGTRRGRTPTDASQEHCESANRR